MKFYRFNGRPEDYGYTDTDGRPVIPKGLANGQIYGEDFKIDSWQGTLKVYLPLLEKDWEEVLDDLVIPKIKFLTDEIL